MADFTDEDLIPEEIITDTGEPFDLEDVWKLLEDYPDYRLRISAMVEKRDLLYGTAEGDVNRIVIVPARKEIVFYADYGNFGEEEISGISWNKKR